MSSPNPKQQWQVKQPTRNWLDLPLDVTANIINRIGVFDILENVQKVCTTWRKICKDPAMWRVICMANYLNARDPLKEMCKNAVDRSQGQLVDITIGNFCDDELLLYVSDRSSQLKRLEIACCYYDVYSSWTEALKKFPLLEELNIYSTEIPKEAIEVAGRYCPMLKTLKVNQKALWCGYSNEIAVAIGENLPELRHLELIGNIMSNDGLQVILDGCRHLESLDLRQCVYIDLSGDLGKRCLKLIKHLKLPKDSLEGCPYYAVHDDDYDYDDYRGDLTDSDDDLIERYVDLHGDVCTIYY